MKAVLGGSEEWWPLEFEHLDRLPAIEVAVWGWRKHYLTDAALIAVATALWADSPDDSSVEHELMMLLREEYDQIERVVSGMEVVQPKEIDVCRTFWMRALLARGWELRGQSRAVKKMPFWVWEEFDHAREIDHLVWFQPAKRPELASTATLLEAWKAYIDEPP